jgi:MYXO-CTERM domain-containing protein
VADDGTVYIATDKGVRRVSTDGEIDTVVEPLTNGDDLGGEPESLALDAHGNMYLTAEDRNRLYVVVRPGELSQPFPWGTIWLIIGALAVLAVAAFVVIRRRRTRDIRAALTLRTTPLAATASDSASADPADSTDSADPAGPADRPTEGDSKE